MEWLANLIALGFAITSLIAAFRWIESATAKSPDPGVRRAKRSFFLAFAALFVLLGATFAVYFAARPQGYVFAGTLAVGTFFAGLVPICHWGALAQIRAMGLQGEGPVILSPQSRRAIRLPLIGGNLLGVLAATVLIWFGPRTPPAEDDTDYIFILAMCLTFAGAGWPMFVVKQRVDKDRAAARSRPPAPADTPPTDPR